MGPRNQFDISDRVEIGGVEITRANCILMLQIVKLTMYRGCCVLCYVNLLKTEYIDFYLYIWGTQKKSFESIGSLRVRGQMNRL